MRRATRSHPGWLFPDPADLRTFACTADTVASRAESAIWAPQWWIRPLVGCLGLTLPTPNDYDQLRIRMRLHNVLNSAESDVGQRCGPRRSRVLPPPWAALSGAVIRQRRLGSDPAALVPVGWAAAKRAIEQYVLAGISKFVIRPAAPPASLDDFLSDFTRELMPLQT
jgi:hypothetical protein